MAKVNVNSATRDEFIEVAGLKPQVADALLRLRNEHGGKVAGLDALKDLAQTTGASMDQLRDALEFGMQAAQKGADAASFAAKSGADVASFAAKRALSPRSRPRAAPASPRSRPRAAAMWRS
jgi:hypothetical protein